VAGILQSAKMQKRLLEYAGDSFMKSKILFFAFALIFFLGCCFEPPDNPPQDPPVLPPDDSTSYLTQEIMEERALDIQALLAFNGIEESVVRVSEREVIVRYNQPEVHSETDAFLHIGLIIGVVTSIHPETEITRAQIFISEEPITEIAVNTSDFLAYRDKETNMDEFIKSWELKELS
jgi:hypothetical protein